MEQDKPVSQLLSFETVSMHGIDYIFRIGTMYNNAGIIDGLCLQVSTPYIGSETRKIEDFYFDSDFAFMKAVQLASIESERADPGFMERNGTRMFQIIADRIKKQQKNKAKRKVFSLRFNNELQTQFAEKCKQSGRTQSEVMRTFMVNFIAGVQF